MAATLHRVPVSRITAEARQVQLGRGLLTLVAGILFMVGWLAAKAAGAIVFAAKWSFAAMKVGWQDARSSRPPGGA